MRERQSSLALGDAYTLPTLDLLNPPPPALNITLDKASLERNARLLESVLEELDELERVLVSEQFTRAPR